jgi:hypothetical protein
LLVAALDPPVARTVLVGGLVEWSSYDGRRFALSTHEYSNGSVDQYGYRNLQLFALEGALPVWTFALGGALLEKRAWMAYTENTTYITYRVLRGTGVVDLEITPPSPTVHAQRVWSALCHHAKVPASPAANVTPTTT